ncbi:hypothetical protein M9H77_07805 [Catharanthus roseus]|uniref:Uncharacterized protein n=1 Tax=Catharanthus roseus TaxID=4058 RepID=A0ACC0BW15_CATRO|nr:hypothetical protein M9H77_07805 [Catharanthus roseus]
MNLALNLLHPGARNSQEDITSSLVSNLALELENPVPDPLDTFTYTNHSNVTRNSDQMAEMRTNNKHDIQRRSEDDEMNPFLFKILWFWRLPRWSNSVDGGEG